MALRNLASIVLASCAVLTVVGASPGSFPIVDLGYARHTPTKTNYTAARNISYATYSNIRFAQPPLGDLRFRSPQTPPPSSDTIQDGVVPRNSTNCLQAVPSYFPVAGINGTSWGSEDCLFLDVIVPEGVQSNDKLPVLHWLYGGGYFFGAKDTGGNPASLFDEMTEDQKFIIVASNYRLGALGWVSSETEQSMTPNAGLYDGLAALEWTRDNIHLFGGDPNAVTVMGQSAGSGIIEHLLAANTQGKSVPFTQAILSSPGYRSHVNRSLEMTEMYRSFLNLTDCDNVECLRGLDSGSITEANRYLYQDAPPGGFPGPSIGFAPVLDHNVVTDVPSRVLLNNDTKPTTGYVKRVLAGHMKNDGAASTIGNYKSWEDQLSIFARTPTPSTVDKIKSVYGDFNGSRPSVNPDGSIDQTPFDDFSGDTIYACHAHAAAAAYSEAGPQSKFWEQYTLSSSSYRYMMSVPRAFHGVDLNYYFYSKVIAAVDPTVNAEVARKFQHYLRRFILGQDLEDWPEYSSTGLNQPSWMNITTDGFKKVVGEDETRLSDKCKMIMELLSNQKDGW